MIPPAPNQNEVELIDFRALWGVGLRQYRLISATALALFVLAIVAIGFITPKYTSQALLTIDPRQPHLANIADVMSGLPANSAKVDSEVEILKSNRVALKVIASFALDRNESFKAAPSWFERIKQLGRTTPQHLYNGTNEDIDQLKTLQKFGQGLAVKRRGLTYIVEVAYTSADPKLAADIANGITHAYLDLQTEAKRQINQRAIDLLKERLTALSAQLHASEKAVDDFMEAQVDLALTNTVPQKFETALRDWQKQRDDVDRLAAQYSKVRTSLTNGNFNSAASLLANTSVNDLLARQKALEAKEIDLRALPDTPSQALFDLQNRLRQNSASFREVVASEVDNLRIRVQEAKEHGLWAEEIVRDIASTNRDQNGPALEFWKLQQDSETTKVLYETFLSRLRQTEQLQSVQIADSRIISAALPTLVASYPPTSLLLVIFGLMSLGLAISAGVLRDRYAENIHEETDLEQALKIPVLTGVPEMISKNPAGPHSKSNPAIVDMIVDQPVSALSEAVRRTRISLELAAQEYLTSGLRKANCVMVASAAPGEGKSTLAILLARSWSQAGKKVALLDFDFRSPSIHALLESGHDGSAIAKSAALHEENAAAKGSAGFQTDPKSSMKYIHARNWLKSPNAEYGITALEIGRVIDDLKRRFDVVLIDTPPLLPVADAKLLLPSADITLFVARASSSTHAQVLRAYRDVQQFGTPVVAVLNGIKGSSNYANNYPRSKKSQRGVAAEG